MQLKLLIINYIYIKANQKTNKTMINLKNYINLHFLDFLIVLLNIFYFLPKTIEWLNWDSGITMGYVGIELIFNYLIKDKICFIVQNYLLL